MVDASLAEIQTLREQLAAAREVAAEVARIKAINADLEASNALLELQNEKMRRALYPCNVGYGSTGFAHAHRYGSFA